MIEFLSRDKVPTSEEIVGKFVFGSLPLTEYRNERGGNDSGFCEVVGVPTYVTKADAVYCRGNPVKFYSDDAGVSRSMHVIGGETHRRDLSGVRIVCDTEEEALALVDTRREINDIISKCAGYESVSTIRGRIESVYDGVKNRFAPQMTPGEALMKRVAARLAKQGMNSNDVELPHVRPAAAPAVLTPRF